jgi:hypothetical protein
MAKLKMPKSEEELRALSDADLEKLRVTLAIEQDQLRTIRKVLALETERRDCSPKAKG